jgi:predicted RNA-binding Zn ribbon-like protein
MTTETPSAPPAAPEPEPSAPGDLLLLQELVNTFDVEPNTDELPDVAALRAWLTARDLLGDDEAAALDGADLARVTAFREAMRVLLRTNLGDPIDPAATALLNTEAERASLRVQFTAVGCGDLVPIGQGTDKVIGRLLAAVAAADAQGTWKRLKVCADDSCAWAFYDVSRNASRAWCSMATCGNRNKARRFRRRGGAQQPSS